MHSKLESSVFLLKVWKLLWKFINSCFLSLLMSWDLTNKINWNCKMFATLSVDLFRVLSQTAILISRLARPILASCGLRDLANRPSTHFRTGHELILWKFAFSIKSYIYFKRWAPLKILFSHKSTLFCSETISILNLRLRTLLCRKN